MLYCASGLTVGIIFVAVCNIAVVSQLKVDYIFVAVCNLDTVVCD